MGALKIVGCPGVAEHAHGYFSRNFKWAFVPIDPMNVHTKFEVPEIIGGTQKFGPSLDTPTLPFLRNF